ncbi:FAD-binding protein, partial [SAR86 cluster bacterium]|nr:FAD-binding protein [SAR86 cluster bacterium]
LSFPMEGTTLTMDFPYQENKVNKLFSEFSLIVSKFNGKIYPAKDINIDKQNFKKYFKDIDMLSKFKDPNIDSDFWKRVS